MKQLSEQIINQATKSDVWDFGNEILYQMCREYPLHNNHSEIIGKIWLIGRSYAAAIERRKAKFVDENDGEDFYVSKVVPAIVGRQTPSALAHNS